MKLNLTKEEHSLEKVGTVYNFDSYFYFTWISGDLVT